MFLDFEYFLHEIKHSHQFSNRDSSNAKNSRRRNIMRFRNRMQYYQRITHNPHIGTAKKYEMVLTVVGVSTLDCVNPSTQILINKIVSYLP